MELLQLRYFADAANRENFSETAARFHIPQSAVSQTVKKLETELGVQLFDRLGNRVRLNEQGRRFLQAVETALPALDSAVRELSDGKEELSGEVRLLIRCSRRLVTECISAFRADFPKVSISLTHDPQCRDWGRFDLIVAEDLQLLRAYERELLLEEPILLAVPSSHRLAMQAEARLGDLQTERFVSMTQGSSLRKILTDACRTLGFTPIIGIESDDPYYVRSYVAMGLGIALIPAVSWSGQFDGSVRLLSISDRALSRQTYVCWRPRLTAAALRFRDRLLLLPDRPHRFYTPAE